MSLGKILALDKVANFFRIISQNGGIRASLYKLYRQDELKDGTLVGEDKYGNKYFENPRYFYGRNRWVEYADKYNRNYDGSQSSRMCLVVSSASMHTLRRGLSVCASVAELEKAITEQGNKVRDLKASTKDKTVWQPEVKKLLDLKSQLTAAQATSQPAEKVTPDPQVTPTSGGDVAELEKAIAEQGDKVRKLKASTKDKTVWQPEVNVLLDLKKRLAALQVNK